MILRTFCLALLLAGLAGCGTAKNTFMTRPEEGGKTPFGGVRQDLSSINAAQGMSDRHPQVAVTLLCAVDLPFSVIGDLVMWPYTAAFTFINSPTLIQSVTPISPVVPASAEGQPLPDPKKLPAVPVDPLADPKKLPVAPVDPLADPKKLPPMPVDPLADPKKLPPMPVDPFVKPKQLP